jgi:hypothetical protein
MKKNDIRELIYHRDIPIALTKCLKAECNQWRVESVSRSVNLGNQISHRSGANKINSVARSILKKKNYLKESFPMIKIVATADIAMIRSKPEAFVVALNGTVVAATDGDPLGFASGNAVVDSRET